MSILKAGIGARCCGWLPEHPMAETAAGYSALRPISKKTDGAKPHASTPARKKMQEKTKAFIF